jgi:hypothetical protein
MLQLRSRDEVASADAGWLKARHHFAIGPYGNPAHKPVGNSSFSNDDEIERCAFHSDGSDAGQGKGVLATRTSAPATVTAGASMRMTRHLATSTPDRAATSAAATAPPVAINHHAWKR